MSTSEIINTTLDAYERVISETEKNLLARVLRLVGELDTDAGGRIRANTKNMRLLTTIKTELYKTAGTPVFRRGTKEFLKAFDAIYEKLDPTLPPRYAALHKQVLEDTKQSLSNAAIYHEALRPLNDMLTKAVTTAARFDDLVKDLSGEITGNYARTYATTALTQYAGQNNKFIAEDTGAEWFEYVGSNIKTTRPFCLCCTKKRYIHRSEFKDLLKGKIGDEEVELSSTTNLPKGMIEGTDEDNLIVNVGGWNCRHQLVPISTAAVPQEVKDKIAFKEQRKKNNVEISKATKAEKQTRA